MNADDVGDQIRALLCDIFGIAPTRAGRRGIRRPDDGVRGSQENHCNRQIPTVMSPPPHQGSDPHGTFMW